MAPGSQTRARLLLTITLLLTTYVSWCVAGTVYWTGEGGDGLWNTTTNWREGDSNGDFDAAGAQGIPGLDDTAVIDDGDANTTTSITHAVDVVTTLKHLLSEEQILISDGKIKFTNNGSVGGEGSIVVQGGEFQIDNTITLDCDVTVTSGVASFKKGAVMNGDLTVSGGTVTVAKEAEVNGGPYRDRGDARARKGRRDRLIRRHWRHDLPGPERHGGRLHGHGWRRHPRDWVGHRQLDH